jgi:acetone carboxylase gamma subunit
METTEQIAKHLREVFFGGNWTCVNVKQVLGSISVEQANIKVEGCNTILSLSFHINYFIEAVLKVMQGNPLDAKDAYSFNHPIIDNDKLWTKFREKILSDAEDLASLIEKMPDHQLMEDFTDPKYGSYYRNFLGLIEHTHYHLGQIVVLERLIENNQTTD